ncbi:Major facilitator superfamily domain general substrate transporter [Penicillium chermesinum]|nr:Major facilitator superfamily domain general substrate transporter [Penicillium chermesinum]
MDAPDRGLLVPLCLLLHLLSGHEFNDYRSTNHLKGSLAGTTITWAGTAFLLGQTVFQPLYGRISDIVGRKPVLLASVGCIFLGDLLSGWAQNALWLYITRARNEDDWRWVFWIPSILAFVCTVVLVFLLPLKPVLGSWREKVRKIDWYGIFASVTAIVLLLVPINSGGSIWSWHSALVIALLTLGSVSLVIFIFNEGLLAKVPLMPLRLFRERSLTIMLVSGALHDYVWQATQYFMPLYFQEIRGFSALESATLILPYVLSQSLAGATSGPLMSRFARNLLRSLGSVFGVAISTAVQNAAIKSSLHGVIPSDLLSDVLEGSWSSNDASTEKYRSQILDAKMKGFRVVFIILLPIMCLCFIGNFFVADTVLKGDAKQQDQEKAKPLQGEALKGGGLEHPRPTGNLDKEAEV